MGTHEAPRPHSYSSYCFFAHVQGQLRMWVDIFDRSHEPIPPPVNIVPRLPEEYELRVIVWKVMDVPLNEESLMTGEYMSDIYVKGYEP